MTQAPTALGFWTTRDSGPHARLRNTVKKLTRVDLYPTDAVATAFMAGLSKGDPIAERFVAETSHQRD